MADNSQCKVQQLTRSSCNSWWALAQQAKSLVLPEQTASPAGKPPGRGPTSYRPSGGYIALCQRNQCKGGKTLTNKSKEQNKGGNHTHAANEMERPAGSILGTVELINNLIIAQLGMPMVHSFLIAFSDYKSHKYLR